MQTINNRMTETQIADLFSLAVQLQVKAEESDDRDTAILAYSIQNACSNLTESQREFRAADATIHNLELKLTDMAVQLANAESKCRELEATQSYAKDRDEENQDLMLTIGRLRVEREASEVELANALCELLPGTQYMDPPDGGSVTPLEQVRRMVADYRGRIEELESRTVNLPEAMNSYAGVKIYRPNDVIEAIHAAGIGVKGE